MPLPDEILAESSALFHDTRAQDIDPEAHAAFVIERVLDRGTLRSVGLSDHKYGTQRTDRYHRLRALAYFGDAEREPMPDMLLPFDWDEAKRFFTAEATRLLASGTE